MKASQRLATILSLGLGISMPAFAAVPGGSMPITLTPADGATVYGAGTCAVSTTPSGMLATTSSLMSLGNQLTNNINSQIGAASQVNDANLKAVIQAIEASTEELSAHVQVSILSAVKAILAAENAKRNHPEFSRPPAACGARSNAVAMHNADATGRELGAKIEVAVKEHRERWSTQEQFERSLATIDRNEIDADVMFPADNTSAPVDPQAPLTTGLLVIESEPPLNLSSEARNTPPGRDYENLRTKIALKKSASNAVVRDVLAVYQPTIKNVESQVRQLWAQQGGSSNSEPPGLLADGSISKAAYQALYVQLFSANPNYFDSVGQREDPTTLLRDLAYMRSAEIGMQLEQLRLTRQMAFLLAQMHADAVDQKYKADLEKLRQAALNSVQ